MKTPLLLDADSVASCSRRAAVEAIDDALAAGVDPADDLPRSAVPLHAGQFLLMPSENSRTGAHVGIKVATVAPENSPAACPAFTRPTCSSTRTRWHWSPYSTAQR